MIMVWRPPLIHPGRLDEAELVISPFLCDPNSPDNHKFSPSAESEMRAAYLRSLDEHQTPRLPRNHDNPKAQPDANPEETLGPMEDWASD